MNTLIIFLLVVCAACALPRHARGAGALGAAALDASEHDSKEHSKKDKEQNDSKEAEINNSKKNGRETHSLLSYLLSLSNKEETELTSKEDERDKDSKGDSKEDEYDFFAFIAVFKDPETHKPIVIAEEIPLHMNKYDNSEPLVPGVEEVTLKAALQPAK